MKKATIIITIIILVWTLLLSVNEESSAVTEKKLFTNDGTKIAINLYQTGHKEVLIIAPGWFMCKDSDAFEEMSRDFSADFDVISMDFRGHCKSKGNFTFTSRESDDLNTVISYAKKKYDKVYVAGFSLGSATAVITEYKYKNADKLILVSPPTDFDKIENEMWRKNAFIPTVKKFEWKTWTNIHPGKFWLKKTAPIDIISEISPTPILIIAGEEDPTIKPWHAYSLYEKATEPKKLILMKDFIHAEDIYLADKKGFIKTCTEWLKSSSTRTEKKSKGR